MKAYLIAYSYDYPNDVQLNKVIAAIKSYGYWAHLFSNTWIVKTTTSQEDVIRYLMTNVDSKWKFFVVPITNEWVSYNLTKEIVDWLKSNV